MTSNDKDKLIEALRAEVTELRQRLLELERRLGINSTNSSKPPSSDSPNVPKKSLRKGRKKRGGQKGHEPHLKEMLPPDQVTRSIKIEPDACPGCGGTHFVDSGKDAIRDQFIDVPPVKIDVTEYVRSILTCTSCGVHVYASLPENAPKHSFGPGVLALVAVFTGALNISKRKAQMIMNEVFNVPISLGGLSNCEERVACSLEPSYGEAVAHVREQEAAHADETSWRRGNRVKGWLWTLCCSTAAVFMVHAKRSQDAAHKLLDGFCGILISDRWNSYNCFNGHRQICWAHLKRDFVAIGEAQGRLGEIGRELHDLSSEIFKLRRRVRDGTIQWKTFQSRMPLLIEMTEDLLEEGASGKGALAGKCREIFKMRNFLWTFVEYEDVDPTNNHAERMVRQGVLWRKTSFGTQSERGARYVERILTVCATCRLQKRSVIEFLRETCYCHMNNLKTPSLIG